MLSRPRCRWQERAAGPGIPGHGPAAHVPLPARPVQQAPGEFGSLCCALRFAAGAEHGWWFTQSLRPAQLLLSPLPEARREAATLLSSRCKSEKQNAIVPFDALLLPTVPAPLPAAHELLRAFLPRARDHWQAALFRACCIMQPRGHVHKQPRAPLARALAQDSGAAGESRASRLHIGRCTSMECS